MTGAQGTAQWDQSSLWRMGNTECSIHLERSEAEEVSGEVEESYACFSIRRLNMFLVLRLIAVRALIPPGYLIESAKRDGSNSDIYFAFIEKQNPPS